MVQLSKEGTMHIMFGGDSPKVVLKSLKGLGIVLLFLKQGKQRNGNAEIRVASNTYQEVDVVSKPSIQMITLHILPFYHAMIRIKFRT